MDDRNLKTIPDNFDNYHHTLLAFFNNGEGGIKRLKMQINFIGNKVVYFVHVEEKGKEVFFEKYPAFGKASKAYNKL